MIDFKRRTGKLFTIRFLQPVTEDEFDRFDQEVTLSVRSSVGSFVFCTDLRAATIFTEALSERAIESMRRNSPRTTRVALLLPSESAILTLQFERIVRESGSPNRRAFRKAQEAVAWLEGELTAAEREDLVEFIGEWVPGAGIVAPGNRAPASSAAPASGSVASKPGVPSSGWKK